jgi:hypothetical protein
VPIIGLDLDPLESSSIRERGGPDQALLDLTLSERGLTRHEPIAVAAITNKALRAHDLSQITVSAEQ